ncbi:ras-related protein Rap-2c-like [Pecten maximus]|uniref:ras-related protein Rap-2c-like n=1 Tax=Pecten maximus TaxID=6579 RepID=UPI001458D83B|nr:ras-related protein Rap-2c-like [Pecten maximus]
MADMDQRNRIVFLGAGRVGKSSILKRFLHGTFSSEYKETVEDLYSREYDVQGNHLKVDFLDTAGNIAFPAMRRLSIANAHAFVLVYSLTNEATFIEVKQLWENIKEVRENYQEIPCAIVANCIDMENNRQVEKFDALNWAYNDNLGGAFVEVSAKDDECITDIFKILFEQLKVPRSKLPEKLSLLTRRLSSHSLEQSDQEAEPKTPPEEKKFFRSRSLIRRGSKPKVKRSSRNKNDCEVS